MPVQVQGPDGNTYQFPDGTDKSAAIAYFKKKRIGVKAEAPPELPQGELRAAPTFGENLRSMLRHPLNSMEAAAQPKSRPRDASMGEMAATDLYNFGAGATSVARHPLKTVGDILSSGFGARPIVENLENEIIRSTGKTPSRPDQQILPSTPEEAAYAGGQAFGTAGLGKVGGMILPKVAKAPGKVVRAGQEAVTRTSPSDVANLVRETSAKNAEEVAKATEADKKAAAEHLEKTQEALHETEGRELRHKQEVKAAQEKAAADKKAAIGKHLESRARAIADRKEAEQRLISEQEKQGKITPTQAKLKTAWSNLRAGVETAREKALGIGNEKYSAVNEKLNPIDADFGNVNAGLQEASEKIKGSQVRGSEANPRILDDIQTRIQKGDSFTYEDLQGYYSELNRELSKGTLPGDVYAAYDTLHEAIGNEMQRIAVENGYGPQLSDARNYWRRMKQAFGKPYNPSDVATSTTEKAAPKIASAEEQANRIRLLGSFDSRLPGMFEHVENVQKGVESLPEPKSPREIAQSVKAPAIPSRKPVLPKVEPPSVAAPERVSPPDRPQPTPAKTTTLTPQALSDLKAANVEKAADGFRAPNRLASTFLGYDLMRNAFNALGNAADFKFGSAAKDLFKSVRDVGIRVGYAMGSGKMADLLEKPDVRASLSQITDRDIAELRKLPPDQQAALGSELKSLVDAAPAKGVKVSPSLAAWVGAVGGSQSKKRPGDILKPQ